jgi:hypothetical protein
MRSVVEALELLIQSLELTDKQQERVTRQHEVVRQKLRVQLGPQTDFGFSESGIEFDLVPAYELIDGRGYLTPERGSGPWIPTNPKRGERRCSSAGPCAPAEALRRRVPGPLTGLASCHG